MNSPNSCESILERLKQLKSARREELKALQEESQTSVGSCDTSGNTEDFSSASNIDLSRLELLQYEPNLVGNKHLSTNPKLQEIPERSSVLNGSFLEKVTEQVIEPAHRPKFPFLRKGDGTARYGNKTLKGFTKRKLSKNGVIPAKKVETVDNKSRNLQAFEELEDLVGHESFQSTAPHVINLLDINESITSTPIPLKKEARKINLIERYVDSIKKCPSAMTKELNPSKLEERSSMGKEEHKNCRSMPNRVKFTSGLEVLEYEDPSEITSANDSDIFNNSDLEVLKAKGMCYEVLPKLADDQSLFVKSNAPSTDSTLDRVNGKKENILPEKMLLLSKIQCLDKEINVFKCKNQKLDEELKLFQDKSDKLEKDRALLEIEKRKHAKAKEEFLQYALAKQDLHDNSENISTEAIIQLNFDISEQLKELHNKMERIQSENCELKSMLMCYQDKKNQSERNSACPKDSLSVLQSDEQCSAGKKTVTSKSKQSLKRPLHESCKVPLVNTVRKSSNTILNPPHPIKASVGSVKELQHKEMNPVDYPTKLNMSSKEKSSCLTADALIVHDIIDSSRSCEKDDDLLPPGTIKNVFPDRTEFTYPNGDVRIRYVDRSVYKFFGEQVVETSFTDGKREIDFPNGQKEVYFSDGSYQVIFANSASVSVYKDGSEKNVASDGTVTHTDKAGKKVVYYPNGQKEIFQDECVYRVWPDGTTKAVHKDGTQETKYPNGKVRIKDRQGNISFSALN